MMRSPILVLGRRDLMRIMRDKAFIFMAASQLVLLSLSLTFSHFLPIIASGDMPVPNSFALVCVSGDDAFWAAFANQSMFERNELKTGLFFFQRGTYDALVSAEGYDSKVNGTTPIQVDVYVRENSRKPAVVAKLKAVLESLEGRVRADRVFYHDVAYTEYQLDDRPPSSVSSLIYTVLLPFFIIFLAVGAGNMTITLLANESEEKTLETLLSAPLAYRDVLISKSATSFAVVLIQLMLWVAAFGAADIYLSNPILLLAYALAYVVAFVSLGLISYSFGGSRDAAQNIYAVFMLPSILVLLPMQSLPKLLEPFLNLVPTRVIAQLALTPQPQLGLFGVILITIAGSVALFALAIRVSEKKSIY
jgi:ABC-type Na+ efflux pump permease subunit